MSTPIVTAEDADRRFVFHPFTQLDRHEQTGSPTMIVCGSRASRMPPPLPRVVST